MKRYKMTNDYGCGYGVSSEQSPEGEWVKWEDVKNKFFNCDDCIFVTETCTEKCPAREYKKR